MKGSASDHKKETVTIAAVSRDEEGRKRVEKIQVDSRNVDGIKYVEKKLIDKGVQRLDRQPRDGLPLKRQPKGGHGGKYTWEGPLGLENEADDESPVVLDENDPNYVDEDIEGGGVDDDDVVIGEVEVPKVAKEGVARVDVVEPR